MTIIDPSDHFKNAGIPITFEQERYFQQHRSNADFEVKTLTF